MRNQQPATSRVSRSLPARGLAALAAVLLLLASCTSSDRDASSDGEREAERPHSVGAAAPSDFRPSYHLTPARHWMNDPQRPFFLDGRWHLYYLYNADHPHGNGTAWFHATSSDLVHWRDEGVAIDKYRNGLGDIQTGSAVIDVDGTAGFGRGAVIALVTQQDAGVQRQSLFYSTDGGYSFTPYADNPVMDNPGSQHWRDPKVIWDDTHSQWVLVLAEGHKLGFYTSPDLKTWTYRSGFERDDLGLLECPDLFRMSVDGDPSRTTWVLAASANGEGYGRTTGLAYWTGTWDGARFTAESADPSWLDSGSDFYAAVTWDDPRQDETERLSSRYAIGWMNNWAYAGDLPLDGWAGGMLSTPREVTLTSSGGRLSLRSRPVAAITDLTDGEPTNLGTLTLAPEESRDLHPVTPSYRLRTRISTIGTRGAREVRIRVTEEVTVGYNFAEGVAFVVRNKVGAAGLPPVYDQELSAPLSPQDGVVEFDILVDVSSVEAFVNGGEQSFSMLSFGDPAVSPVTVQAVGGEARLAGTSINNLADSTPQRAER